MTSSVSDHRSNAPEQIEFAVKIIGRSKHRRQVFDAIYFGKKAIKTVKELSLITGLSEKRVLEEAKKLADNEIIRQTKKDKITAYGKYPFYSANKKQIERYLNSPSKLKTLPTKRKTVVNIKLDQLTIPRQAYKVKQLTIDDIESFKRVKAIKSASLDISKMSETQFKNGVIKILGERGQFKDWGGEANDLLTTKVMYKGKRIQSAFAFKGPGTKGKLTPAKMGKNGDQILRLFKSPSSLFVIQYWGQIEQSLIEQVESYAKIASLSNDQKLIFYCIVDGQDSARIVEAYQSLF